MAVPLFVYENERRNYYRRRKVLEDLSDFEVRKHTGLPWWAAREIIELFSSVKGKRSSALPLDTKVLCFLSYLRSGSFQYILASSFGTTQSKVSDIIAECTEQALDLVPRTIYFRGAEENLLDRKEKFYEIASFPNVIGVIDGTHIPISAPHHDPHLFVNRKGYHSINCQVVLDSNYTFLDLVAKWPGSSHDSFIWKHSSIRTQLSRGDFGEGWILGDNGYPLEPRLLTPYLNPTEQQKRNYNKSFIKTRTTVERGIGVWKSRFRSMCKTGGFSCYSESKVCKLINASAVLHNICIRKQVPLLPEDDLYVRELNEARTRDSEDPAEPTPSAAQLRNQITSTYF